MKSGWVGARLRSALLIALLLATAGPASPAATLAAPAPGDSTAFPPRFGHVAVADDAGRIYVFGGSAVYSSLSEVENASSAAWVRSPAGEWSALPDMPTARTDAAAAISDGRIYVAGGGDEGKCLNSVDIYDVATGDWLAPVSMSTARCGGGLAAVEGRIYAFGGRSVTGEKKSLDSAEVYDPAAGTWTTIASMPDKRWGFATAVAGGRIYVFGGRVLNGNSVDYTVETNVYDPGSRTWSRTLPLLGNRLMPAAATGADGRIYVTGGYYTSGDDGSLASVEVFDPRTATRVSDPPTLATPRAGHAAVSLPGGQIVLIGGLLNQPGSQTVLDSIEVLDTGGLPILPDDGPGPPAALSLAGPETLVVDGRTPLSIAVTDAASVALVGVEVAYDVTPAGCGTVEPAEAGPVFHAGTTAVDCTLTASVADDAAVSGSLVVHLVPGPLDALVLSPPDNVYVGDRVTIGGVDAFGNTVDGVVFSSDDGLDFVDQAAVVASQPGVFTIRGRAGGVSRSATLTVRRKAATLRLTAPELAGAGPVDVTLAVLDADGNLVEDFSGPIGLSSSDADASLPGEHVFTVSDGGQFSFSVQFATEGRQSLVASDPAEVLSAATAEVTVSRTPPVTTAAADGRPLAGWVAGDVTITLTATPGLAPLAGTFSRLDDATESQAYREPFTVSAEGNHTLAFWSEDEAGNVETEQTARFGIDRTAPEVDCRVPDVTQWYGENISVTCTASDALSGLSGGDVVPFTLTTAVGDGLETDQAQAGTREICDLVDNCATAGPFGDFKIDRRAPAITSRLETVDGAPYAPGTSTVQAVTVRFTCTDDGSGVDEAAAPQPVTFDQPGENQVTSGECRDRTGHSAALVVDGINIRAAVLTADVEPLGPRGNAGWYVGPVIMQITPAGDAVAAEYRVDGGSVTSYTTPFTIDSDGGHSVAVRALGPGDAVGAWQTSAVWIDATPPSISCDAPGQGAYTADVVVACDASDAGSGLAETTDAQFTLSTSVPDGTAADDAATDSRVVYDLAGNRATAGPFTGYAIDKRPAPPAPTPSEPSEPAPVPPATPIEPSDPTMPPAPAPDEPGELAPSLPADPPAPDPAPEQGDQPQERTPAPAPASPPPATVAAWLLPATAQPGCTYFVQTGHNLCLGFRDFWERFGGLERYGYPLTEEFVEDGLTVQYFERARFEWHPGVWPERYDVLLGRLWAELNDQAADLLADPPAADAACRGFVETGRLLCGEFRSYWEAFGGMATFGLPLTDASVDRETGLLTQYFERARFEWHPGVWPDHYDVLLGRIGAEYLARAYGTAW